MFYSFLKRCILSSEELWYSVADPGFPVGGGVDPLGGRGPPTWVLFSKNVCENKRIWSRREGHAPGTPPLDPPMVLV